MKAILISDHAIWCALMMNGIKKIEIRKGTALYKATQKLIDEYGYAEFYVYCTKKEDIARIGRLGGDEFICERYPLTEAQFKSMNSGYSAKGKVIFKFRCYRVETIKVDESDRLKRLWSQTMIEDTLLKCSCLTQAQMYNYLPDKKGFAILISELEIFDRPKELGEFRSYKVCNETDDADYDIHLPITKAPQNYCYVEGEIQ